MTCSDDEPTQFGKSQKREQEKRGQEGDQFWDGSSRVFLQPEIRPLADGGGNRRLTVHNSVFSEEYHLP
jgi:hypothetical protein